MVFRHHPTTARVSAAAAASPPVDADLGKLDIPVAERVAHEGLQARRGIAEAILLERHQRALRHGHQFGDDPRVDGVRRRHGQRVRGVEAAVEGGEAGRVPQLVGEEPRGAHRIGRHADVLPVAAQDHHRHPRRIGAVLRDELERIDDVALRLRHLLPLRVAHEAVDVDVAERRRPLEMDALHHHPGDPEEDDVEARDEQVLRVIAGEFGRLVRPAQRREGPECRREPRVEDVGIARQDHVGATVVRPSRGLGLLGRFGDEDLAVVAVPGRDLVAVPELAADAPGLDVVHPAMEHVGPVARHEAGLARPHRLGGGGGEPVRPHEPLVGDARLEHDLRPVAERLGDQLGLDLLDQPHRVQGFDHASAAPRNGRGRGTAPARCRSCGRPGSSRRAGSGRAAARPRGR